MANPGDSRPTSARAICIAGALSLAVAMGIGRFAFTPMLPLMIGEGRLDIAAGGSQQVTVRYTPLGGEIVVRWEEVNGEARFSVKDSGIGIEPQHIPRLTERFYRVDRSRSRETGGTGLGLSIVKHVLTRHQSRLEIASEVGQGSTFSAVFPASRLVKTVAAA